MKIDKSDIMACGAIMRALLRKGKIEELRAAQRHFANLEKWSRIGYHKTTDHCLKIKYGHDLDAYCLILSFLALLISRLDLNINLQFYNSEKRIRNINLQFYNAKKRIFFASLERFFLVDEDEKAKP